MKKLIAAVGAAAALMVALPVTAHAETIQANQCQIESGATAKLLVSAIAIEQLTTGKARLLCPFTESFTSFTIYYRDDDDHGGAVSVKVSPEQDDHDSWGHKGSGDPNCFFRSNFAVASPSFFSSRATVVCAPGYTVTPTSFQTFVIELWSKARYNYAGFVGIVTYP